MRGLFESAGLQLRVAKRLAARRGASLEERLGRRDDRFVFVLGSPRSGTTFLAEVIGSLPGFVDLGEVAPIKAAIPRLAGFPASEAARQLRRILTRARRMGLVGTVRPIEQTPEMAYLIGAIVLAYPDARIVHMVRDGRDVVASLLDKGWLSGSVQGRDDAGIAYGAYPRFWVEPDRGEEFASASDARRAAWAWRRYVSAARREASSVLEVRYELLAADPQASAAALAAHIDVPEERLAVALGKAHGQSVGRFRTDLSGDQLADVMSEAGGLLAELGYVTQE